MLNPKEIGASLKKAREKKSLSFEAAHKATRIQIKILKALEEGAAGEILPRLYLLLFLKKYALLLDLDPEKLAAEYKAFHTKKDEQILNIKRDPCTSDFVLQKWVVPVVGIIVAIFIIFSTLFLAAKVKSLFKTRKPKTTVTVIKKDALLDSKAFPIPQNKPIELALQSTQNVWMRVKTDDKIIFDGTLEAGKKKEWSSEKDLILWVARAEVLDFAINGKTVGKIGKGNIKNIQISRTGLKIGKKWLVKAK